MKIFITGGGGVLGRHLAYRLANAHDVHIIDNDVHDVDSTKVTTVHYMNICEPNNMLLLTQEHSPDVIIHLAEMATIDTSMHTSAVRSNMVGTAEVINACTRLSIRGIVGSWVPLFENNMMLQSLNQKRIMISYYNRGNTVINVMQMPHILHPEYPSSTYGAIINRLYNAVHLGQPFFLDSKDEGQRLSFCTIDGVYEQIIDQIRRRTRDICYVQGVSIRLGNLIPIALNVFDAESVTLYGKDEPYEYLRNDKYDDHQISRWIRQEWSSFFNT